MRFGQNDLTNSGFQIHIWLITFHNNATQTVPLLPWRQDLLLFVHYSSSLHACAQTFSSVNFPQWCLHNRSTEICRLWIVPLKFVNLIRVDDKKKHYCSVDRVHHSRDIEKNVYHTSKFRIISDTCRTAGKAFDRRVWFLRSRKIRSARWFCMKKAKTPWPVHKTDDSVPKSDFEVGVTPLTKPLLTREFKSVFTRVIKRLS